MRELPGQNPEGIRFGRYILHRKIGIGGMAEVWLAEMQGPGGFGRIVALKRLHAQLSKDQEFIDSFISEARVGGSLDHPNIVRTIEFGQEGSSWYLAMEYVQGVSLTALLRAARKLQQPIPTSVSLEIMRQLFEGLTYAHSATDPRGKPLELVHRDLKPGNILLDRYGQVRVSDFGIARSTAAVRVTMAAGVLKGTLAYMSPEQASCQKLDARSDLYSAGSMFFELLAHEPLHPHAQGLAGLHEVMKGEVGARLSLLTGQPTPLVRIVTRLLQPRREDRYESSLEVLRELQALQSSQGRATEVLAQWVQQLQPASGGPLLAAGGHAPVASSGPESMLDLSEALQTSMEPVSELGRLDLTLQRPDPSSAPARVTGRLMEPAGVLRSNGSGPMGTRPPGAQVGGTIPVLPVGPRDPSWSPPPLEPTVPVATGILPLSGFVNDGMEPMTGFVEMTHASSPFSGVPERMEVATGTGARGPGAGGQGAPQNSIWMQLEERGGSAASVLNSGLDPGALMAPTVLAGQIPQRVERRTVLSVPVQPGSERATIHLLEVGAWPGVPVPGSAPAAMPAPAQRWPLSPGVWIGVTLGTGALLGVLLAVFWGTRTPEASDQPLQEMQRMTMQAPVNELTVRPDVALLAQPMRAPQPPAAGLAGAPQEGEPVPSDSGMPPPTAMPVPSPVAGIVSPQAPPVEPSRPAPEPVKSPVPPVATEKVVEQRGAESARAAPRASGSARLTVNARPFAWVYVNGKKLPDPTPLWDQKVPAGTLKLRFVAEDGRTEERSVTLKPGESRRLDPVVFP